MEAQVLLKQGAVRRVGKGDTINILQDPWLPGDDPFIHTDHAALRNKTVDTLMVSNQNAWDVELINDIFVERDVQLILSLPLRYSDADNWFWKWEKLGHYTVKSAYAALREMHNASNTDDNFPWKKVWNMKIPLKVKHFIWRAIKNILPTKDQLITKRVSVIDKCHVCNEETETIYHSLVSCRFAQQCWRVSNLRIMEDDQFSFSRWMYTAFQICSSKEIQGLVMLCWSLWKNRNEIVWNQREGEYSEVCRSAKTLLNQWKNTQDKSFNHFLGFMNQEDGKERWEHPQEGTVNINVDAAIFESSSSYYLSMVARDHGGALITASASCRYGRMAPVLVEALSIKEALSWSKQKNMSPVIIETDCLAMVQAIRCSTVQLSYLGRVVEDCKILLSELKNRLVTLSFVKRSANKVAHFLARHNSSVADRMWNGDCVYPEFHHVLRNDLF